MWPAACRYLTITPVKPLTHAMPAGHPTHLTPRIRKIVGDKLRECVPIGSACAKAGITRQTFYNWMNDGEEALTNYLTSNIEIPADKKRYVEFFDTVKRAQADAQDNVLMPIRKGKFGWQAQAWILERLFPQEFGRTQRHEVSGPDGKPIESTGSVGLSDELASAIRKKVLGVE